MDVQGIMTLVKRQFGDESGVQVTDDDLIRWINASQKQLVLENEQLLQVILKQNSTLGVSEYPLPTDLLILQSLSYKGPSDVSYHPLKQLNFNEFNEYMDGWDGAQYGQGLPLVYMVYANTINLFPPPDAGNTDALKIYYNRKPVEVTGPTDVPEVPEIYHTALVNAVLTWAYEMDEDWDAVNNKGQQVEAELKLLRGREQLRKGQDTYSTITVRPEDMD